MQRSRKTSEKIYIVYDARGHYDTEEASILVTCNSKEEAFGYKEDFGDISVWEYPMHGDVIYADDGIEVFE